MQYDSISERKAAPIIAQHGGARCNSFAPLLPQVYEDAEGAELRGKPDFLIHRGGGFHFIESKNGILNNHYTLEESTDALREAYREVFWKCGDRLTHSELSTALMGHSRGRLLALQNAWNHSLWKVLALQAKHGWQRYLVVFERNPSSKDASRYCKAGLVWCTLKTLPDMLRCIELMRHGFFVPFYFNSRNYNFTVTPDYGSAGLTQVEVEFNDRVRFLAAVATDKAVIAAQRAQDRADWDAGILPF